MSKPDKRQGQYFGAPKKLHTEIKHHIFEKTLERSLSIANQLCSRFKNASYTFIDLYAGKGTFEDGASGSPLIARDLALKFNDSNFNEINLLFVDTEEKNVCSLREQFTDDKCPGLNVSVYKGQWSDFDDEIRRRLSGSEWGFVFADPFSTELNINEFEQLIQRVCSKKDLLVFVNFRTMARQHGRALESDIERICKALNVSATELLKGEFGEKFKNAVQKKFAEFQKEFILSAAIPIEAGGILRNTDYFYLVLSTNSTGVADAFLQAYSYNINKYKKVEGIQQISLFEPPSEPREIVLTALHGCKKVTLYDLFKYLYRDFFSWKHGDIACLPTQDNVLNFVNELWSAKKIKVHAPEDFISKKGKRRITKTATKKNDNLKKVIIDL